MSSGTHQKLAELVSRFGRDIADDPRRCEALLRDVCPQNKREIFVLVSAARDRVCTDLLESSLPPTALLNQLMQRMHEHLGVEENLARWAVSCWAHALQAPCSKQFYFHFACPRCGATGTAAWHSAGQERPCPKCNHELQMRLDGSVIAVERNESGRARVQGQAEGGRTSETLTAGLLFDTQVADVFHDVPRLSRDELFRQAIRRVLADGIVTEEERAEVHELRTDLGISREVAARIVSEIQAENGRAQQATKVSPPSTGYEALEAALSSGRAQQAAQVSPPSTAPFNSEPAQVPLTQSAVQAVIGAISRSFQDHTDCYFWPYIPADKMCKAVSKYAQMSAGETVLFLYDNTVWGGAGDGVVVSGSTIYAHDMGSAPKCVRITDISAIDVQNGVFGKKVMINGEHFVALNMGNRQLVIALLNELRNTVNIGVIEAEVVSEDGLVVEFTAESAIASSGKRVSLEDVLLEPETFNGEHVQIKGVYAGLYTRDASFKLEDGDHEMWVVYSQLPRSQKSVILSEGEASGRAVIVEGVLHCGDGDPELTASRVAIQGMKPQMPPRSADGSIDLAEILLDPSSFDGQQVRLRGTYAGLYTRDSSFKLEQGDHEFWVFYSQLPKEQKSIILRESEASGRAVSVEGVLHCGDGDPELTATSIAIEGMTSKKLGSNKSGIVSMPDWDGCGPCSKCRTVINMKFENAVCPICGHQMSWQEAFQICGSHRGDLPRNVYSERDLK